MLRVSALATSATKRAEVDMGAVVGAVGDGAHHGERATEVVAHLGHGGAFHFDRQRVGQGARNAVLSAAVATKRSPLTTSPRCSAASSQAASAAAAPARRSQRQSLQALSAAKRDVPVSGTS